MSRAIPKRIRAVLSDQIIFSMLAAGDMQIHCIVLFDGRIDKDRMARAVRLSLDAEPVLGCRFGMGFWRPYWDPREDLDDLELCKMVETSQIDQEMIQFLTAPVDPFEDPQVRLRVLRSEQDVLCIKVNHLVADAGGVKEYLYLLASIYRELFNNSGFVPETNIRGSRSLRQVSRRFGLLDKLGIIRRSFRNLKNNLFPRRYWTLPLAKGKKSDRIFIIRRIGPEQFRSIKEYCRMHAATINDVIVSAFYRALSQRVERNPNIPHRFLNTADLRRYLPTGRGEAVCNLSGFVYLNIGDMLGDSLDDTVKLVRSRMNFMKNDYIGLGDYPLKLSSKILPFALSRRISDLMYDRLMSMQDVFPPCLTNMGVIHKERLLFGDPPVKDVFLTAPVMHPPLLGIGVSGYGESMTMSAGFSGAAANKPVIERLFDEVEDQLQPVYAATSPAGLKQRSPNAAA